MFGRGNVGREWMLWISSGFQPHIWSALELLAVLLGVIIIMVWLISFVMRRVRAASR